jgi:ABC-type transporter Mla subunit MlaD
MNTDIPRRTLALVGLVAAVLSAAVGVVLLAYGRGDFDDTYELRGVFPSSSQGMFTDGGTEVKMRGVNIGTVRGIELLPDGQVEVRFSIREGVGVPRTARARIEPLSVFGPAWAVRPATCWCPATSWPRPRPARTSPTSSTRRAASSRPWTPRTW